MPFHGLALFAVPHIREEWIGEDQDKASNIPFYTIPIESDHPFCTTIIESGHPMANLGLRFSLALKPL